MEYAKLSWIKKNSHRKWFFIILAVMLLTALLLHTNRLWMPWLGADLAAKYLLADDGKDPLNDSRKAALYWGKDMYSPLSKRSTRFSEISWVAGNTLLDILSEDSAPPEWLLTQFSEANNDYIDVLYCYVISRDNLKEPFGLNCANKLQSIDEKSDYGKKYLAEKMLRMLNNDGGL